MKKHSLLLALSLATYMTGYAQLAVKQSFSNVTTVVVDGISSDVTFEASNQNQVDFDGVIHPNANADKFKIQYKQTGSELKVWIETPSHMGGFSGTLAFKVPQQTNIKVHNVSGDVNANGLTSKLLEINNVSGDINLQNNQSDIQCKTVSGDILLNNQTGSITLNTVSGDILLNQSIGTVKSQTVSGDTKAESCHFNNESTLKSVSGDINTTQTKDIENLSIEIKSTSGDLKAGNITGDDFLKIEKGSARLHAETVSGDITIQ